MVQFLVKIRHHMTLYYFFRHIVVVPFIYHCVTKIIFSRLILPWASVRFVKKNSGGRKRIFSIFWVGQASRRNKKPSWETARRESKTQIAEMDAEMTTYGWNDLQMYLKVIKSGTNRKLVYDFLLVLYSNVCRISYNAPFTRNLMWNSSMTLKYRQGHRHSYHLKADV